MDYRPINFSPCPGNLQDSTTYTINGACYAVDDLIPGEIVSVIETSQRYKGIGKFNGNPFGVVFLDGCNYQDGDPIPVVSKGKVFVLTRLQEQPEPLQQVYVDDEGLASLTGVIFDRCLFTGTFYRVNYDLSIVGIQLP